MQEKLKLDLEEANRYLSDRTPAEIVKWCLDRSSKAIVTTNFRPYEAVILHAVTAVSPKIPVVWCDTGYNTPQTYRVANQLIDQLSLNIDPFVPKETKAYRDVVMGIPEVDDERHAEFTKAVKLEPFQRAFAQHQPEIWFTNLRKGQTALRDTLDILSWHSDGTLKVSPFYHYSDEELEVYLSEHDLPNEMKYYDPTKALANRECGLHT